MARRQPNNSVLVCNLYDCVTRLHFNCSKLSHSCHATCRSLNLESSPIRSSPASSHAPPYRCPERFALANGNTQLPIHCLIPSVTRSRCRRACPGGACSTQPGVQLVAIQVLLEQTEPACYQVTVCDRECCLCTTSTSSRTPTAQSRQKSTETEDPMGHAKELPPPHPGLSGGQQAS
jgi:hypothetical protein